MAAGSRRLQGLNPTDRPQLAPATAPPAGKPHRRQVPPPIGPVATPRIPPTPGSSGYQAAAEDGSGAPLPEDRSKPGTTKAKTAKVMHSVPGDLLDQLKAVADRTGMTYTDIVLECIVTHRRTLAAERHEADDMDVLERRVRKVRRQRQRAVQLTLYLTRGEREALDGLAARLAMQRSEMVTEALKRGLEEMA